MVNTAHTKLYRVFNGGWCQGGRFYGGWWQNVPKTYRAAIRMDDAPTVEPDYSRLHPNLLYFRAGETLGDDPYDIPGWPVPIVKRAFLIVINARNYRSAVGAIAATIREYPHDDEDAFLEVARHDDIYQDEAACIDAANLIRGIKDRHQPIARYFHSGIGLELQNLDSRMAEMVMRSMRKKVIAVLPIHDSFMVPIDAESMLLEAMSEALEWAKNSPKITKSRCREFLNRDKDLSQNGSTSGGSRPRSPSLLASFPSLSPLSSADFDVSNFKV